MRSKKIEFPYPDRYFDPMILFMISTQYKQELVLQIPQKISKSYISPNPLWTLQNDVE